MGTTEKFYRIVNFQAENFKRLKVVNITPDGNVVQITGANGHGKSSVLDAIYAALAGATALPGKPVRKGEDKAMIRLDLGEIIVTRKFTANGATSLTVESANGARFPSPQRMLDDLLGALTFDPLAFTKMEPKQQIEQVRGLVKLDVDVDALRGRNKTDFEARTELNRDATRLKGQLAGIVFPADTPVELIDTAALTDELEQAGQKNTELEQRKARRETATAAVQQKRSDGGKLAAEAVELRQRAQQAFEQAIKEAEGKEALSTAAHNEAMTLEQRLQSAEALPEPVDTAEVKAKIAKAQATNKAVALRQQADKVKTELEQKTAAAADLTTAMDARTAQIADAIARAKFPVEGLAFADSEVTFNDLPLSQASDAEKLQISMAIAMAANPKLRVLRIKEGSLLDSHALKLLAETAAAHDYQIWLEKMDESGKIGIVMEDGAVHQEPDAETAP